MVTIFFSVLIWSFVRWVFLRLSGIDTMLFINCVWDVFKGTIFFFKCLNFSVPADSQMKSKWNNCGHPVPKRSKWEQTDFWKKRYHTEKKKRRTNCKQFRPCLGWKWQVFEHQEQNCSQWRDLCDLLTWPAAWRCKTHTQQMSSAVLPVSFSADFFSQFTYVIIIKYSGILLYHWNHKYCFFFMGLYKFVLVVAVPLHVRIVGEGLMNHSPTNASFFFLSRVQLMYTNSTLSGKWSVHSGSMSWNDCGHARPDKLHVSSYR